MDDYPPTTDSGSVSGVVVGIYGSGMADREWQWEPNIPRSVQIADEIEQRIRNGTYPPKHPIYELRIVQEFGVARETARKAVRILRDRGLIHTVRGLGSFVGSAPNLP